MKNTEIHGGKGHMKRIDENKIYDLKKLIRMPNFWQDGPRDKEKTFINNVWNKKGDTTIVTEEI